MYKKERKRLYRLWLILYAAGFLAGLFLMKLIAGQNAEGRLWFWQNLTSGFPIEEIHHASFLKYEVGKRFQVFGILLLFATTCFGMLAMKGILCWFGLLSGMTLTFTIHSFGIKGILLLLASMFPQYLLFIPAFALMLCWCHQTCCLLYFKNRNIWVSYRNEKRQILYQLGLLLWIFCMVLIGCVLESYVNPILVADVIKWIK